VLTSTYDCSGLLVAALLKLKQDRRERKLAEAKANNELCGCCFDDELLLEEMLSCPDGHLFCTECIRRSTEEVLGQAKLQFPCLQGDCSMSFSLSTLQKAVKPKTFDLLLRKTQENEIEQAGLEDLVKCPFCTFATIMPNPDDKVLYCKNPDCLKESCR
jgi:TRIAD3 protein (E3 ubiquitin-protein ligase RNF216)